MLESTPNITADVHHAWLYKCTVHAMWKN
jgi:hypothetical protein